MEKQDYTILEWCSLEWEKDPHGLIIQLDNGDTQYLTTSEYETFLENRKKLNKGNKVFLVDIDGTICDDIKNEDSHLYSTAKIIDGSVEIINNWYDEGNIITFFTAREGKDREVTEQWLKDNGFKYHGLVMDKPRIKDGQTYHWIDNRKIKATTFNGKWTDLIKVSAEIEVFNK